MTYLLLFYEFFKAGLFAIGGGMATLPFLNEMAVKYPWFTTSQLSDMIAISESTPGPIGVNMATYAGFTAGFSELGLVGGFFGALTATVALVTPSVIIIVLVAKVLDKFKDSRLVKDAFYTLRPAVTALIAVAGVTIMESALLRTGAYSASGNVLDLFNFLAIGLFLVIFIAQNLWKKIHPIVFIVFAAAAGIVFQM